MHLRHAAGARSVVFVGMLVVALALVLLLAASLHAPSAGARAAAEATPAPNSVQAFGAAPLGDLAGQALNQPVVGMAATADGGGYWLVAKDGGIFTFGDATYRGSTGAIALHAPIVGMAADPATGGYWLVAADGGVFAFGAPFYGSRGGQALNQPVVGMAATADGGGYWLVAKDGGIFTFGDAPYLGNDLSGPTAPAVGISSGGAAAGPGGYRVAYGNAVDPLGPAVTDYLSQRAGNVTAALYDANSGATFVLNPGDLENTASIVKVDIMVTALQEARQNGGSVPAAELGLMPPMIEQSDNDAATDMWNDVGGPSAVARYNENLGLTSTTPNDAWGLTTTSAADQVKLVKALAYPNTTLSGQARAYGLSLMENVEPTQAWGVTGGVPPGVTVALKNGWLPLSPGDWQVNSIGFVAGAGRDYVLAVLTDDDPTEAYGIATIEGVSRLVFAQLSSG
jgi:hypothetical protein